MRRSAGDPITRQGGAKVPQERVSIVGRGRFEDGPDEAFLFAPWDRYRLRAEDQLIEAKAENALERHQLADSGPDGSPLNAGEPGGMNPCPAADFSLLPSVLVALLCHANTKAEEIVLCVIRHFLGITALFAHGAEI